MERQPAPGGRYVSGYLSIASFREKFETGKYVDSFHLNIIERVCLVASRLLIEKKKQALSRGSSSGIP